MAAEQKKKELNFEKICRACLEKKKDMRPLFEQLNATMLMTITKVQVSEGDGLPSQLCLQCVHQISRCQSFKDMVERNDVVLKEYLANNAPNPVDVQKAIPPETEPPSFLEYIDMPGLSSSSQILDGFFTDTIESTKDVPDVVPKDSSGNEIKVTSQQNKDNIELNSDEETYLQMVAYQAKVSRSSGTYSCKLCLKEFKTPRYLKNHLRSHTNWIKANCKKPPKCHICHKSFKGPGMLKMHMQTHQERPPKQPTCSVCQKVFTTKAQLYRHRQTHFEHKALQCSICEKRFYSAYALKSHLARHRGEKPYICAICCKSFYNPTDLKVHFRLHTGEKPLKCSVCSKTFRRHSTLCQHMKKHRGIRNHVCLLCNKAFYEVSKLNAHMRVHTGERPFACEQCDRRFAQRSALLYHWRTHSGEKPFSCRVCGAHFTTSSARNNHLLAHAGANRHTCAVCGKKCATRSELRAHGAAHAPRDADDAAQCSVCGETFTSSAACAEHVKTHEVVSCSNELGAETVVSAAEEEPSLPPLDALPTPPAKSPPVAPPAAPTPVRPPVEVKEKPAHKYKCSVCVKTYTYLHSLKKHMLIHTMEQEREREQRESQPQGGGASAAHVVQVGSMGTVQQVALPLHHPLHQAITVSAAQQAYPVISSVHSLQLQQTQQQVSQPQQLQVQAIQLHPQQQPIQIHAVGVQQVQQQQLHVATSSCQTMLPNILQLQPSGVTMGALGQGEVAHRIILQPHTAHPIYTIHQ